MCYEVNEEVLSKQKEILKDNIKSRSKFICKNYKKQLASTSIIKAVTDDDFVEQVEFWAKEYLRVMEAWE